MKRAWLLLLAGCSSAATPGFEERLEWRRASARLTMVDTDASLGRPLRVKLELLNEGPRPFLYEASGVEHGSLDILGPDGKPVSYIGWPPTEHGEERALDPRSSVRLLYGFDLSTEYMIDRPGRYRLRFAGRGLRFWKPEDDAPGLYPIRLVSDWADFKVGEGEVPPPVEIASRLRPILPKGWRFCAGSFDRGRWVVRLLRSSRNGDEINLLIGGATEYGFQPLAKSRWGPISIQDGCRIDPDLRPALLDALTRP